MKFNSKRPAGTKIVVTFSFTENKTMNCEFLDEETSVRKEIDLSFDSLHEQKNTIEDIDKFLVEWFYGINIRTSFFILFWNYP